jgi:hypothetical protein
MLTWLWAVIVVIAATALLAFGWMAFRGRRTRTLKERFGPEYDRVAADAPTRREAEAELRERADRRESLDVRPLDPRARDRFSTQWRDVQAQFVDDPAAAVASADRLIQNVMHERGYPIEDFDRRAADLSVDHPTVVENYRAAHGVAVAHERGRAGTEELRKAIQHYRRLFEELVEAREPMEVER